MTAGVAFVPHRCCFDPLGAVATGIRHRGDQVCLAALTYTAALGEGASVAMALDNAGKVVTVSQNVKDKDVTMCSSQKC